MSWLSEKDYDFIYSRAPRICVDLVIKTISGVHLTKREIPPYKGKWNLPGGRVRFRESVESAIQRIAQDEIGMPVQVKCVLGFMEFPRESQNGSKRHSISIAFLCKAKGKPLITEEVETSKILSVHYKFLKEHKIL